MVIWKWRWSFWLKWTNWCNWSNRRFSPVSTHTHVMLYCVRLLTRTSIFVSALRLTLVSQNTAEAQYLSHALFGILMLLPQTEAFILLKNRLQCVPHSMAFQHKQWGICIILFSASRSVVNWISYLIAVTQMNWLSDRVASILRHCWSNSRKYRNDITSIVECNASE